MALLRFDGLSFAYPYAARRTLQKRQLRNGGGRISGPLRSLGLRQDHLIKTGKRELRPAGSREGQVLYQNTSIDELSAESAFTEIGYVQQNPEDQIVTDFVWHELAFGLENLALPTKVIRRRVAEMAAFFGMEPWFRKKTSELSGGQKQMLNLASVMAMSPKLLILDEPTSMLDPLAARSLLDTVERINRELGVAVLLTEHRLDAVFPVCDRVLVMDGGKLRIDGAPAKIAAQLAQETEKERLYYGLPAPVRICGELGADPIPLSVRQARGYLKTILKDTKPQAEEPVKQEPEREDKPVLSCKEVWMRYASTEPDVCAARNCSCIRRNICACSAATARAKRRCYRVSSERQSRSAERSGYRKTAALPCSRSGRRRFSRRTTCCLTSWRLETRRMRARGRKSWS